MFFSGLLSSLLGWFIFRNLEESPYFKELKRQQGNKQAKVSKGAGQGRVLRRVSRRAATLVALAIAFIGNAGYAPVLIILNERFPTALRASGTGLSWNIGFALGGMMPPSSRW
ncbi:MULTISPECIES: hypothetical protein [unclassified Bradyrhizobium]|uniref:hypothetical protein n=1 Tax=unclassified Bradyrhizobium TaxID=2631580 RepID=UPI001FF889DB|nr:MULTISPECIES: hypothetical protein [unclassified Bradyrhizobium]